MANPLIDLAHQVRLGRAFALPKEAGGTARDDGRGAGVAIACKSRESGDPLVAGDVVELEHSYAFGQEPGVRRTTTTRGRVFGVVVDGGGYNDRIHVVTSGSVALVLLGDDATNGQYLFGNASGAAMTATFITGGVFGVALASGSAGDLIPAYVECDIIFVGRHGQLAESAGVRGHTDLVRGSNITITGWTTTNPEPIRDGDPSTSITEFLVFAPADVYVDLDLGLGRETPVGGFFLRSTYGDAATRVVTLYGDDDPAFGSATTIYTDSAWPTTDPASDHEVFFPTSAPFRYYRLHIDAGGGQFFIHEYHLWEAAGAVLVATDPATGDGAYLDDILVLMAPPAGIWRPILDPTTGEVLQDATTGEAIMGLS